MAGHASSANAVEKLSSSKSFLQNVGRKKMKKCTTKPECSWPSNLKSQMQHINQAGGYTYLSLCTGRPHSSS